MKAAIVDRPGATARYGDFAEPEPGEDEVGYDVLAASLHPIVRGLAAGRHYGSQGVYPLVPGVDCVARGEDGVVRYAGFVRAPWGTMAERVAARPGLELPAGADPVAVAGALNPGLSSWLPLTARAHEVGDLGTVLVVGATGVAGRIAVQNAFALGARRVVGVGRDAGRLAEAGRLGAEPVRLADGPEALRRALGADSPTLVLDYLWGSAAELVWEALGRRGLDEDHADVLHVEIGTAAGPTAALPGALLRSRHYAVRGSGAGSAPMAELFAQMPVFVGKIASGEVVAPVEAVPLSRVADAWAHPGARRAVIVPDRGPRPPRDSRGVAR